MAASEQAAKDAEIARLRTLAFGVEVLDVDEGVTRFEERGDGEPVAKRPRATADAATFCTLKRLVEVKQVDPARVP
jgi:hypothetical protein